MRRRRGTYCVRRLEPTYDKRPPSTQRETTVDHYETMQINANAEPETVHRVYRLLAQRFHPDNKDTGNAERFRTLTEAYEVLSDPERRGPYDTLHHHVLRERPKRIDG